MCEALSKRKKKKKVYYQHFQVNTLSPNKFNIQIHLTQVIKDYQGKSGLLASKVNLPI